MKLFSRFTGIAVTLLLAMAIAIPAVSSAQTTLRSSSIPDLTSNCDFCLASQGISPLEVGSSGFRLDVRYLRVGNIYRDGVKVDNTDGELESHLTQQFSFFQALSSRFTISAIVPVASRHSEILAEDGSLIIGNQFGLGDISFLLRFKPLVEHSMETTSILSLTGGVKIPSGRTNGRDSQGSLLDAHIQLGTGSTDFLAGASGFLTFDRCALITNLLGSITTQGANGHTFGNSLNYDATVRYKLYPAEYADMEIFGTLGVNGEWRGREIEDGVPDQNSGGNVTYVSPGAQIFFTPSISFEALFEYPVIHDLYGRQLGEDFRITSGLQLLF